MSVGVYLTRIVPVLSLVAVTIVLLFSFFIQPYRKIRQGQHHGDTTFSQLLLSAYTIFLHLLSVMFPARVCWAMGDVTKKMRRTAALTKWPKRRKMQAVDGGNASGSYPSPTFVIIVPAYKEEMHTMEETLKVLGSHVQARSSYHLYLAMEQKEDGAAEKAIRLINEFQSSFHRMSYTVHPGGIPGEAQGKSSNENWAATQAMKDYPQEVKDNILITVMDADTHLSQRYFAQIAKHHLEVPKLNQETIYVPPIVFDRNLDQVPLPVRTADLMWAGAGISNLYPGSAICIPTSVYTLPMTLVESVGGWDTDPGSIGEDMHMYLKCFFHLSGNLQVKIVYAAASQCNVSSDKQGLAGYIDGLAARYKQALRHMWGTLDTGYALRQTAKLCSRHWTARPQPRTLTFSELALSAGDMLLSALSTVCTTSPTTFHSSFGLSKPLLHKPAPIPTSPTLRPAHILNILTVFLRLFEAHFLPLHLSLLLTVSSLMQTFSTLPFPRDFALALTFCAYCRWVGWALVVAFFYRYNTYLRLCAALRKEEMRSAGLLNAEREDEGFCSEVFSWCGLVEAGVFPLGGFVFGAFPAAQAIVCHLWTERLTYTVSLKPSWGVKKGGKEMAECPASSTTVEPIQQQPLKRLSPTSKTKKPLARIEE